MHTHIGFAMERKAQNPVREALELAEQMIRLSERIESVCDEDGCLVVYGVVKDCGYKIRGAVERVLNRPQEQKNG